jgi:hypothetical protein
MTTKEPAAIPSLREAAEALEHQADLSLDMRPEFRRAIADVHTALATPAPVPGPILSDERIDELWKVAERDWLKACQVDPKTAGNLQIHFARAVASEVAAVPGQSEPVALVDEGDEGLFVEILQGANGSILKRGDKLYAAPAGAVVARPDLAKLKALAQAAEGVKFTTEGFDQIVGNGQFYGGLIMHENGHTIVAQCVLQPWADFIAAANPAVILALIDALPAPQAPQTTGDTK